MSDSTFKKPMAYAAGLALAVTLSACTGGDPPPVATTPPTTPVVTTTTTTPTTPVTTATTSVDPVLAKIPAAARPETRAGAVAYAKFYFDALDRAYLTGSPDPLDGLATPSCKTCAAFEDSALGMQKRGEHYSTTSIRATQAVINTYSSSERSVVVAVTQERVAIVNRDGSSTGHTSAKSGSFAAALVYDNGRWSVAALQVMA